MSPPAPPDFFAQLSALSTESLRPIASAALSTHASPPPDLVDITSVQVTRVTGGASSAAVFRVSGLATHAAGTHTPWSAIAKCRAPNPGSPSTDHTWWHEANAYRTGLLPDHTFPGLQAARCLAIHDRPGGVTWLWLEDLAGSSYAWSGWSDARHALAARHLGAFNGAAFAAGAIPSYPWLSHHRLNYWVERVLAQQTLAAAPAELWHHPIGFTALIGDLVETHLQHQRVFDHPRLRAAYPTTMPQRLLRLWRARGDLLAALDRLPHTLVHGDAHSRNLFSRHAPNGAECTIAIDWEDVGPGPIGEDAGRHLGVALLVETARRGGARQLARAIVDGYVTGLWDIGLPRTHQTERAARYTAYVNAAFFMGFWAATLPPAALSREAWSGPLRAGVERFIGEPVESLVDGWAEAALVLLDLGEQALELLPTLST